MQTCTVLEEHVQGIVWLGRLGAEKPEGAHQVGAGRQWQGRGSSSAKALCMHSMKDGRGP